MSVELTMLVYATGLLIVLVLIQASVGVQSAGLMPLANHRDNLPPPKTFHARMLRVVDNHREGLTMFAPLALAVAFLPNASTHYTVLGAQMFFWARLAHAILYVAGVPLVRPLAWGVGVAGTVLLLLSLLGVVH